MNQAILLVFTRKKDGDTLPKFNVAPEKWMLGRRSGFLLGRTWPIFFKDFFLGKRAVKLQVGRIFFPASPLLSGHYPSDSAEDGLGLLGG